MKKLACGVQDAVMPELKGDQKAVGLQSGGRRWNGRRARLRFSRWWTISAWWAWSRCTALSAPACDACAAQTTHVHCFSL